MNKVDIMMVQFMLEQVNISCSYIHGQGSEPIPLPPPESVKTSVKVVQGSLQIIKIMVGMEVTKADVITHLIALQQTLFACNIALSAASLACYNSILNGALTEVDVDLLGARDSMLTDIVKAAIQLVSITITHLQR